jgi:hypothetical protein
LFPCAASLPSHPRPPGHPGRSFAVLQPIDRVMITASRPYPARHGFPL